MDRLAYFQPVYLGSRRLIRSDQELSSCRLKPSTGIAHRSDLKSAGFQRPADQGFDAASSSLRGPFFLCIMGISYLLLSSFLICISASAILFR